MLYTDQLYERAYGAVRLGSFTEHRERVRYAVTKSLPPLGRIF